MLISSAIGFSWLGMMAVHELGHAITAWMTGGSVQKVVLPIFGFSRTDLALNPRPLLVAWGGAAWGSLLPLGLLLIARRFAPRYAFLATFFAGICLIANGAYLAGGAWIAAGDAEDILRLGASRWQLLAFGLPAIAAGLALTNGLGPNFGWRQSSGSVDRRAAIAATVMLVAMVIFDLLFTLLQRASVG
ncbi:MAG TPA: M50 family metallopeptidase [Pirellulales bacterium]